MKTILTTLGFSACIGLTGIAHAQDQEPELTYHTVHRAVWEAQADKMTYLPLEYEKDGFIHCSTREQLVPIANAYHRGEQDLLLLEIETAKLTSPLKYEYSKNWDQYFPHIYGPLSKEAIRKIYPFLPGEDGTFSLDVIENPDLEQP